nr:hypothetical protein [Tanacetum cinerariifolium]
GAGRPCGSAGTCWPSARAAAAAPARWPGQAYRPRRGHRPGSARRPGKAGVFCAAKTRRRRWPGRRCRRSRPLRER